MSKALSLARTTISRAV